ncbi:MAG: hypothetical protein ACOX6L_00660 [Syntrophomonadaceae bacterium]
MKFGDHAETGDEIFMQTNRLTCFFRYVLDNALNKFVGMHEYYGTVGAAWLHYPEKAKQRKGASPTDGARVTHRMDAESERSPEAARQADGNAHAETGDEIFMHPNRLICFFRYEFIFRFISI